MGNIESEGSNTTTEEEKSPPGGKECTSKRRSGEQKCLPGRILVGKKKSLGRGHNFWGCVMQA